MRGMTKDNRLCKIFCPFLNTNYASDYFIDLLKKSLNVVYFWEKRTGHVIITIVKLDQVIMLFS